MEWLYIIGGFIAGFGCGMYIVIWQVKKHHGINLFEDEIE